MNPSVPPSQQLVICATCQVVVERDNRLSVDQQRAEHQWTKHSLPFGAVQQLFPNTPLELCLKCNAVFTKSVYRKHPKNAGYSEKADHDAQNQAFDDLARTTCVYCKAAFACRCALQQHVAVHGLQSHSKENLTHSMVNDISALPPAVVSESRCQLGCKLRLLDSAPTTELKTQPSNPICPHCVNIKTFKNNSSLNNHIRRLHTGELLRCNSPDCQYQTRDPSDLRRHTKRCNVSHSGLEPQVVRSFAVNTAEQKNEHHVLLSVRVHRSGAPHRTHVKAILRSDGDQQSEQLHSISCTRAVCLHNLGAVNLARQSHPGGFCEHTSAADSFLRKERVPLMDEQPDISKEARGRLEATKLFSTAQLDNMVKGFVDAHQNNEAPIVADNALFPKAFSCRFGAAVGPAAPHYAKCGRLHVMLIRGRLRCPCQGFKFLCQHKLMVLGYLAAHSIPSFHDLTKSRLLRQAALRTPAEPLQPQQPLTAAVAGESSSLRLHFSSRSRLYELEHHRYRQSSCLKNLPRDRQWRGIACAGPDSHQRREDGSCLRCEWPRHFAPLEQTCPCCEQEGHGSIPLAIDYCFDGAVLYTLQGPIMDRRVSFRKCPNCAARFAPFPENEGVFYHNTRALYQLELLEELRAQVNLGTPIRNAVLAKLMTWNNQIHDSLDLPDSAVRAAARRHEHAYWSFEIQSDHSFERLFIELESLMERKLTPEEQALARQQFPFFCISCGFFPWMVFFDGNRKTAFVTTAKPTLGDGGKAASISMADWWKRLSFAIFSHDKYGEQHRGPRIDQDVIPPYLFSRCSRSDMLEPSIRDQGICPLDAKAIEKLEQVFQTFQSSPQAYPVDDILNAIVNSGQPERADAVSVDKISERIGIQHQSLTNKPQKAALLLLLLERQGGCGAKNFSNEPGRSGGTVDMCCRHGVQYGLKILRFAESPQDIVQLLCALKDVPNCAFYDAWCHALAALRDMLPKVGVKLDQRNGGVIQRKLGAAALAQAVAFEKSQTEETKEAALIPSLESSIPSLESASNDGAAPAASDLSAIESASGRAATKRQKVKTADLPIRFPLNLPALAIDPMATAGESRDSVCGLALPETPDTAVAVDREPHRITKSKTFFTFHDSLHGKTHVKCDHFNRKLLHQLEHVNTSISEHMNKVRKRWNGFLCKMNPDRFATVLRILTHWQNMHCQLTMLARIRTEMVKMNKVNIRNGRQPVCLDFNIETGQISLHPRISGPALDQSHAAEPSEQPSEPPENVVEAEAEPDEAEGSDSDTLAL